LGADCPCRRPGEVYPKQPARGGPRGFDYIVVKSVGGALAATRDPNTRDADLPHTI